MQILFKKIVNMKINITLKKKKKLGIKHTFILSGKFNYAKYFQMLDEKITKLLKIII